MVREDFENEADLKEWTTVTTAGVVAGMVYGGLREATTNRTANSAFPAKDNPIPHPTEKISERTAHGIRRSRMETQLLKISKGTVRGGFQIGSLAGIFSGVQLSMAAYRGRKDFLNTTFAGSAAASALGFFLPGSFRMRFVNGVTGFVTGGILALPFGILQSSLETWVPESEGVKRKPSPTEDVGAAIERLELRFKAGRINASDSKKE